jgi:2-oxoglutarate ferredoxin oxidoreductase subunit alpha
VEDAETRVKMTEKRLLRKLEGLRREMGPPKLYGSEGPEMVLCGWGSTYGVIKEAVDALNGEGKKAAMLHFSEIYPFPEPDGYLDVLTGADTAVCIENNATGQLARLMRTETGYEFPRRINRYDGRPFTVDYILEKLHA